MGTQKIYFNEIAKHLLKMMVKKKIYNSEYKGMNTVGVTDYTN